ncbi:leukotriene B4 receptor 1-like [Anguilla anguilla]|uniref:leukotriene B4 receptor 1-like n=1 Tax=Anguilla anguilla TaxID=7936 RepID=UPI0015A8CC88|nr:leukotriene B4 receptor 1-like [Anguilla anguilla]
MRVDGFLVCISFENTSIFVFGFRKTSILFPHSETVQISLFTMQHLNTSSSNSTFWNIDQVAPSVVLGLCCLMGVPGNIAVIVVIVRRYKSENFTLKLMLNLAVSDLLSLITLPMWIYALLYGWVFQCLTCKLITYFIYCNLYSNLLTVTLMSVQRYLAVLYPQYWARLRGMGERVLLVTLWGLSGVLASPMIVNRDVVVLKDKGQYSCIRKFRSDGEAVAVLLMETLLGFVVPFSILVTSYFCLHKKVNQTAFFRNQRMTRLVTSIVVTFFILRSPFHVINVLEISSIMLKSRSLLKFSEVAQNLTGALTFINNCVDPFLYAFSSRNLKIPSHQETSEMSPPGMS